MNGMPAVFVLNVASKTSIGPRPSNRCTLALPVTKPVVSASSMYHCSAASRSSGRTCRRPFTWILFSIAGWLRRVVGDRRREIDTGLNVFEVRDGFEETGLRAAGLTYHRAVLQRLCGLRQRTRVS